MVYVKPVHILLLLPQQSLALLQLLVVILILELLKNVLMAKDPPMVIQVPLPHAPIVILLKIVLNVHLQQFVLLARLDILSMLLRLLLLPNAPYLMLLKNMLHVRLHQLKVMLDAMSVMQLVSELSKPKLLLLQLQQPVKQLANVCA